MNLEKSNAARDAMPSRESGEVAWNVAHGLVWSARRFPDKAAVSDESCTVDYRTLNRRVNRLAHALRGLGLGPGDRLMLLLGDRREHLEALFAAAKSGVVATPVDHLWGEDEIRHAVDLFEPHGVLFEDATRSLMPAIRGPAHRGGARLRSAAVAQQR